MANDDSNLRPARAQLAEPPYADPHVRWCGRGGRATIPPMQVATLDLKGMLTLASKSAGMQFDGDFARESRSAA